MLSSVALFQSKSGILSGLRASLAYEQRYYLWANAQLPHLLVAMVLSEKCVPTYLV